MTMIHVPKGDHEFMYRYRRMMMSLLCMLLVTTGGGCGMRPAAPSMPGAAATPFAAAEITPLPEDELLELPAPDANGMRKYRYREQLVNDWLGDFPEADPIRKLLLDYVDDHFSSKQGNWDNEYFMLVLGRPCAVEDGWIVPAGKQMGGEWMPDLYYVVTTPDVVIQEKTGIGDVWFINRGRLKTRAKVYSVYYGYVPSPERMEVSEENAHPLEVTVAGEDGTEQNISVPANYPAFLAALPDDGDMADIRIFDTVCNRSCAPVLMDGNGFKDRQPDEVPKVLSYNFYPLPFGDIGNNMLSENRPELGRIETKEPYSSCGTVYAANLQKEEELLRITAYALIEEAYVKRPMPATAVPVGPEKSMTLILNGKAFGEPTIVDAVLYVPDGQKTLKYVDGRIETGKLRDNAEYMLHVRAEFGICGFIEWLLPMTTYG